MSSNESLYTTEFMSGISMSAWMVWFLYTFTASSLFNNSPYALADATPWLPFLTIMILVLVAACVAKRLVRRLASSKVVPWVMVIAAVFGGLLALEDTLVLTTLGLVMCALGFLALTIQWSTMYPRFEPAQVDHIVLFGIVFSAVGLTILLWMPETVRYVAAQLMLPLSLGLAQESARMTNRGCAEVADTVANEASPNCEEDSSSSSDGAPAPIVVREGRWDWRMRVGMVLGLGGAAFLCYSVFPLATVSTGSVYFLDPSSIGLGCLIALVLVMAFFRFGSFITPLSVYFCTATLAMLAVLFLSIPECEVVARALVVTLILALPPLLWDCLSKSAELEKQDLVHYYLKGNLIFYSGALVAMLLFTAVFAKFPLDYESYQISLHSIAMVAMAIGALMVFLVPSERVLQEAKPAVFTDGEKEDAPSDPQYIDAVLLERMFQKYGLSEREKEILSYIVKGRSAPYIRDKLYISTNTVSTHIRHIYKKTGAHSRQEVIDLFEQERDKGL